MAGQFAALCIASGVRGQELWTSFLGGMELNSEAMVRDAQATLTSLSSMHSLDCTGPAVAYVLPSSVIGDATPIAVNSIIPGTNGVPVYVSSSGASSGAGAAASAPGGEASSIPAPTFSGTSTSGDVAKKEESVDL